MAKFIQGIVDRINRLNRKGLCPYYSPTDICTEVHAASLNLWKKYVNEFEKTQRISVYLDPFRGKDTISIVNGIGILTSSNGQYKTAALLPITDKKVTIVDIGHWGDRIDNSVRIADEKHPICRIEKDQIVIRPTSITLVDLYFLKVPVLPVYAYTVVDDDYIYDDDNSVDTEWPEIIHDEITRRVFNTLGLSQREYNESQWSNVEQQKEGV